MLSVTTIWIAANSVITLDTKSVKFQISCRITSRVLLYYTINKRALSYSSSIKSTDISDVASKGVQYQDCFCWVCKIFEFDTLFQHDFEADQSDLLIPTHELERGAV